MCYLTTKLDKFTECPSGHIVKCKLDNRKRNLNAPNSIARDWLLSSAPLTKLKSRIFVFVFVFDERV